MNRFLLAAALAALTLVLAAPASAHYRAVGKDCGAIAFQNQTDSGASDIHAKRTTCRRARRMARRFSRGNHTPFGYSCRARSHDPEGGLFHEDVLCRKGRKRVSWAAT